ncbi:MAG: T9SS type A sorting domain-containing protein [Candidatus Marinimicrobia bacterium]|nr:T9SS type A sorting domain-containing protein [Candidatus Neomarinimicrobiota bacterium]
MRKRYLGFLFIIIISFSIVAGRTINIPGDYDTIQSAIDRAYSGDTVLVQPGTYHENLKWPNGNGIRLIAAGDYTNTILDGSKNGAPVISMDISFQLIDTSTIISGFTIQNGQTTIGGGIFIKNSSPTLKNLHFKKNYTIGISYQSGDGAAIYMINSSPVITDCKIYDNYAQWGSGGGIYMMDYCYPVLSNLQIYKNIAKYGGGGINIENFSSPVINNVQIYENIAYEDGGGIFCKNYSSPIIYDVTLEDNSSSYSGGGIYCLDYSSPVVENIKIYNNSTGYSGGGIYCEDSSNAVINSAEIKGNRAIYRDGGGVMLLTSKNILNNTVIAGNFSGDDGGGIYIAESKVDLMNSLIYQNHTSYNGGGIQLVKSSAVQLMNLKIIDNKANNNGAGIHLKSSNPVMNTITIAHNHASANGGGMAFSNSSPNVEGFSFITNKCNEKGDGIYAAENSEPYIVNCNFMEHFYAIYNDDSGNIFSVDTSYFGNPTGPMSSNDNPTGRGDRVNDFVRINSWSAEPEMAAPPIPMIDFRITYRGDGEITLSWEPLPIADVQKYMIYYDEEMPVDYQFEHVLEVDKNASSVTISGLTPGINYHFAGTVVDRDFYESWFTSIVTINGTVGLDDGKLAQNYKLDQNYPNPFNPTTTIHYSLPMNNKVRIILYDMLGNSVKTLVNEHKSAGNHSFVLDGSDLSSGVYFYKLSAGNFAEMKKCILIK